LTNRSQWKENFPERRIDEGVLLRMATELIDALVWIHSNNCMHLDINVRSTLRSLILRF
jgi:serine/threonine protein kinase